MLINRNIGNKYKYLVTMLKAAAGLEPARGYDADRMKLKRVFVI
ncbi:hypothetical protein BLAHAN_04640 [Blautia hansenii DSM 20583]|uniref:Uncharacterized protein n=1 Tax=Blautia hansenii DSM 20583 TaxID=537007 RepID=C9L5I3_BLAHA|nr:hypothetical protein BLAHAN_04640 [Blautia hansenii DSM 20583]